ncbi:DNA polymerase [Ramlibacter montanisoli]|uniref:DNA-directed DNA polymerase family A palm domain-containing protein n=1 Tax=Ramlibacter montanisoli TaxID=2732512 RepID=A0A849KB48_9BURK|nr:DNA polymerase [Ramlibacter montanisoli]NNU43367.1 hypothetical protein [Ramlibacter montanisoli]
MSDASFLAFAIDRFEQRALALSLVTTDGSVRRVQLHELSSLAELIITHDLPLLIRVMTKASAPIPRTIVDVREVLKLRSQQARDDGGEKQWAVWRTSRPYAESSTDLRQMESLLNAESEPPGEEELLRITASAATALRGLWKEMLADMEEREELQRWLEIEVPVQQIFNHRESSGIRVDRDAVQRFIRAAENEKFSLFRKIASILGYSPLGMTDKRLASQLVDTEEEEFHLGGDDRAIEDRLNILSFRSQSASIMLDYMKAKRDLAVLRDVAFANERVFPIFHVQGTVTSRVLASEPRIQQLRKRYRAVLLPDEGNELTYLDYAQFEPGVLSVLARDPGLQAAYEQSDMYVALARSVFEDEQGRDLAKRIFLAHLYGMSAVRIAALLNANEAESRSAERVRTFFSRFPEVERFREKAQEELRQHGKVASVFGNARRRRATGDLSAKEQRWAMNHKVQATASLIFKRALINIADRFGPAVILLPMHDAVLLQFSPAHISRAEFENSCIELMKSAFTKYCPGVSPKVVSANFAPVIPA